MPDGLITIGRYSTPYEASLVRSKLESAGIEAFVEDDYTINANWMWSNALGGVKVLVPTSQADEARGILEADQPESPPADEGVCPVCGSADVQRFVEKRGAFLTWLLLGLPLWPVETKVACRNCGRTSTE
jgi:hypothetical protein